MKVWIEVPIETARQLADGEHVLLPSKLVEADREKSVLLGLVAGLRLAGKDVEVSGGSVLVDGEALCPALSREVLIEAEAEMTRTRH